jgi:hypothetical protein
MSTQPVRVALEVTWHPADDSWSLARRAWRRDSADQWQLEEVATSGTPLRRSDLVVRLEQAVHVLISEVEQSEDPFGDAGPFVS